MAEESTVTLASGVRLAYAATGDPSGPAAVLLPGPTDGWASYRAVLDLLPDSIRTVAVSQRGHGDSDKVPGSYTIAQFATDAVDLLDALGIQRATLVGHSGSCLVARRAAMGHPGRVAGLVLESSPTTLVGDPTLRTFVDDVVSNLVDPIDPDFARDFIGSTSSPTVPDDVRAELVADVVKVPAEAWRQMFGELLHADDRPSLERTACPTLLVWGEDDPLVTRAMQDELVARLPDATLRVYAGTGHTPRWEHPARFATDVAKHVTSGHS